MFVTHDSLESSESFDWAKLHHLSKEKPDYDLGWANEVLLTSSFELKKYLSCQVQLIILNI